MRLRNKPWMEEAIHDFDDYVYTEPKPEYNGQWRQQFPKPAQPFHVELGSGKGKFIADMAETYPDVSFLGLEVKLGVIYSVGQKLYERSLENARAMLFDIAQIEDVLAPGEVDRFYINFCDPWPKARHVKRRLTYRTFLDRYEKLLAPRGQIHFKTDNKDLFQFSIEEFETCGWELHNVTFDLHSTDLPNCRTEYEEKFSAKGQTICRLEATKP